MKNILILIVIFLSLGCSDRGKSAESTSKSTLSAETHDSNNADLISSQATDSIDNLKPLKIGEVFSCKTVRMTFLSGDRVVNQFDESNSPVIKNSKPVSYIFNNEILNAYYPNENSRVAYDGAIFVRHEIEQEESKKYSTMLFEYNSNGTTYNLKFIKEVSSENKLIGPLILIDVSSDNNFSTSMRTLSRCEQ